MSDDDTAGFYDALAADYHLIHADWDDSLTRQGALIDGLLARHLGPGPHRLLDCSCGIGTQALGLAALGHRVHATDLSAASVERARREAGQRGLALDFGVADMRHLDGNIPGDFDVVLSCDNALAHMLDDGDLDRAARAMASKTRPGGLVLASIRDYDALLTERPIFAPPTVHDAPSGRRLIVQHWDWRDGSPVYDMTMFIMDRRDEDWTMRHYSSLLRAVTRDETGAALARAGLGDIVWHMPEDTGFYQPVVTARKPV